MNTKRYCLFTLFFSAFTFATMIAQDQSGQDSTGLPGDNFSLQGALHLFQMASSPEDFEKQLNDESNHVNNLDLNGDGDIDYIRVVDNSEKASHAFVLQVPVSEKESQDIAVIELEKTGDTTAVLQIIGDEDIYGEEVIVEPSDVNADMKQGNKGGGLSTYQEDNFPVIVVNVWRWPTVRYVYAPTYRPWISPWHWRYYPTYWRPWRPVAWHVWHPFYGRYNRSFAVVHTHRTVYAHKIYTPVRVHSVTVHTRHATALVNYKVHIKKATVTGPKGHKTTVKKTTVKGPKGKVRGTKTTVRRRH
jgi:hypothetical protein